MKPKVYTARAFLFILSATLLLGLAVPAYSQENGSYVLIHNVSVTEHGFLALVENIEYRNSGTASTALQPFELHYPSFSVGNASTITVQGPINIVAEKTDIEGDMVVKVIPQEDYQIQAGSLATVQIKFYLSNYVNVSAEGAFLDVLPLVPSLNHVAEVHSNIHLPPDAEIDAPPAGFDIAEGADEKVLSGVFQGVEPGDGVTEAIGYNRTPQLSLPVLEIPTVERVFKVSNDGQVTVHDEIRVINRGGLKASMIRLVLLNKGVSTVDIVPIEDPPLTNRFTVAIQSGVLNIAGAYGVTLSQDEEFVFGIEYPLPQEDSGSTDGEVLVKAAVNPPIEGVVEKLIYRVDAASGVDVRGGGERVYDDVSPFDSEVFDFHIGLKFVWASSEVIPVATVLFVVALVSLLTGGVDLRRGKLYRGVIPGVEDFVSIFEEKTGSVQETLQSFDRERRGGSKGRFTEAKRYFETLKGRSAGRMGGIRTKIVSAKPYLKDQLINLTNIDREYNRAALDLINLYEQYHNGRIREETFNKLHGRYHKRLETAKDRLNETVEYIHSELEK